MSKLQRVDAAVDKFLAKASKKNKPLEAFRETCQWMSLIFLVGLVTLFFLQETKGKPLPEDV